MCAAAFRPGVIFMDLGMPAVDGYEATRRIRALQQPSRPAIIALTGWGQSGDRRRASEVGMDGHLVKPVDPDQLREAISSHQGHAAGAGLS
jgi:CheY-like chemotaxis protein